MIKLAGMLPSVRTTKDLEESFRAIAERMKREARSSGQLIDVADVQRKAYAEFVQRYGVNGN